MHVDNWERYRQDRIAANESNDCTVISLATLMGWTYGKAHSFMRFFGGREDRRPASMYVAAANKSDTLSEVNGLCPDKGVTLGEFCKVHKRGRYWVNVTGHALAVIDGKIHDHSYSPRRRVRYAWRIQETKA